MVAARARTESKLLAAIRLAVGARHDFMLARINVGVFSIDGPPKRRDGIDPLTKKPWAAESGRKSYVRSAPNGFPDIIGTQLRRVKVRKVVPTTFSSYESEEWLYYGQAVAIETKAPKGVQSEAQAAWQAQFEAVGGIYVLPRSVQEVLDVLGEQPDWIHAYIRERNIGLVGQ